MKTSRLCETFEKKEKRNEKNKKRMKTNRLCETFEKKEK